MLVFSQNERLATFLVEGSIPGASTKTLHLFAISGLLAQGTKPGAGAQRQSNDARSVLRAISRGIRTEQAVERRPRCLPWVPDEYTEVVVYGWQCVTPKSRSLDAERK